MQDHEKIILTTHLGEDLTFPYHPQINLPLMFLDFNVPHAGLPGHHALDLVTTTSLESTLSLLDDNNYCTAF